MEGDITPQRTRQGRRVGAPAAGGEGAAGARLALLRFSGRALYWLVHPTRACDGGKYVRVPDGANSPKT